MEHKHPTDTDETPTPVLVQMEYEIGQEALCELQEIADGLSMHPAKYIYEALHFDHLLEEIYKSQEIYDFITDIMNDVSVVPFGVMERCDLESSTLHVDILVTSENFAGMLDD